MPAHPALEVLINGQPARVDDLAHPALVNYGHFTAMQVRRKSARGLRRHMDRLQGAHREIFGTEIDVAKVQGFMRHAIRAVDDAYLRVTLFEEEPGTVSVMTALRPPVEPGKRAQTLLPIDYVRPFAHLKHVGAFAQIRYGELAERAGHDDALLVAPDGRIAETTIANIAFVQGENIVWPSGPSLYGITWQLLDQAFAERNRTVRRAAIKISSLGDYEGAFLANSVGLVPVSRIGPHDFDAGVLQSSGVAAIFGSLAFEAI